MPAAGADGVATRGGRGRSGGREAEVDPFYDMLFNMLIAFVFCFIIALLAMNPKALKTGDIPAKAEYIITVSWPDMNPNDIEHLGARIPAATSSGSAPARPG